MRESFDSEEAEPILERAAARGMTGGRVSRERLLAMAEELGIPPEDVEAAAAEIEAEREEAGLRREFIAERRTAFWAHLLPFLTVNLMLLVINLLTSTAHLWFLYPLTGWGIGMASHAFAALPTRGPQFEKEFAEWRQQRTRSQRRRERRASKKAEKAEVQQGGRMLTQKTLLGTIQFQVPEDEPVETTGHSSSGTTSTATRQTEEQPDVVRVGGGKR